MNRSILLDTDVLIDFLRGHRQAVQFIGDRVDSIILSSIVVAELYAGVKGNEEQNQLDDFISLFPVVPVTSEIARSGGLYKKAYQASHGVGLADAILAATAEIENAELMTLNTKHYPMLKNLKPPYSKK